MRPSSAALVDRCIHRGVALSLGRLEDHCLECPFHGWRYDVDGRVVHVPWNPDAKLPTLRTQAVPARELAGQLWVRTSFDLQGREEPEVNDWVLSPNVRVSGSSVEWKVHWTRAMENMLDWPHLPFVHASTIGRKLVSRSGGHMDIDVEDQPWGFRSRIRIDGEAQPGMLDFRWPNQMNLHIVLRGRKLLLMVACVPIDAEHTKLLLLSARDFLPWRFFDPLFNRSNHRIAAQDRDILESSQPLAMPDARHEKSVRTDAPLLRFRKLHFERLSR